MHRVAWVLVVAAVLVCAASAFVHRPWSVAAPIAAVTLLVGGLVVAWFSGRGIERRWRDEAISATLEVEQAVAEFTRRGATRYAIVGRVVRPGQELDLQRSFQAFVPVADAPRLVAGVLLPVSVLAGDDAVRLHLHPDRPDRFVLLQAR
ncbi:hypothetical protein ACFQ1L_32425 [Phytohabitans flavus]|uniref:hypothetical protein n=1 Tax=Phytohabitans flavus TaxID=1076124 RepID=UPI001564185D|nr:hypothetical protein [Phytohabitans flavus]